jgi:uncharacterized protein YyaL (SSP411 family)
LGRIQKALFNEREKRVHPAKDDKILADWNGLMIAALARASQVFGAETYLHAAVKAASFILERMRDSSGTLFHRYAKGEKAIRGFLDDYAFLAWGLLEVYEASFEDNFLTAASELTEMMITQFWDERDGGFNFTAKGTVDVVPARKEVYDGALPSGNSVALLNLLRLARLTGNSVYEEMATRVSRLFSEEVTDAPSAHTFLLLGVDFTVGPAYNVILVGNSGEEDTLRLLKALRTHYLPNMVVSLKPPEKSGVGYEKVDGKATAYVCRDQTCLPPTNSVKKMLELLGLTQAS